MVGKVHEGEEEEGDDDDPYVEDGVDALPINEPPEAFPSAKLDPALQPAKTEPVEHSAPRPPQPEPTQDAQAPEELSQCEPLHNSQDSKEPSRLEPIHNSQDSKEPSRLEPIQESTQVYDAPKVQSPAVSKTEVVDPSLQETLILGSPPSFCPSWDGDSQPPFTRLASPLPSPTPTPAIAHTKPAQPEKEAIEDLEAQIRSVERLVLQLAFS